MGIIFFEKQKNHPIGWFRLCRRRPIFPGSFPPSIFGTVELNYRVRDGNGWNLNVIDTDCEKMFPSQRKQYYSTGSFGCQVFF